MIMIFTARAETAGETFARICLVVEETSPTTGEIKTSLFDENSRPGSGRRLSLYADANIDAYALVAAFQRDGQTLAYGWLPRLQKLEAWEESHLPMEPMTWDWTQGGPGFEIHVAILSGTEEDFESVRALVEAMGKSGDDPEMLALQTVRLRESLDRLAAGGEAVRFLPGVTPSAWGGTLRGTNFEWRHSAQKIPLSEQGRGYFIYPVTNTA